VDIIFPSHRKGKGNKARNYFSLRKSKTKTKKIEISKTRKNA
jgi:hypothetical protein